MSFFETLLARLLRRVVTAILLGDLRRNGPIAQALNSRDDPLF